MLLVVVISDREILLTIFDFLLGTVLISSFSFKIDLL